MTDSPLILALDFTNDRDAMAIVNKLDPRWCQLKVGFEMFVHYGPKFVETLQALGFKIFLDLKLHDIPNTVAQTVKVIQDLGVWMTTLHIAGGKAMLRAACEAVAKSSHSELKLMGVTVLTSLSSQSLREIGIPVAVDDFVNSMADVAQEVGLDGIVCSAHEVKKLKNSVADKLLFVTPGIQLANDTANDQVRTMTPQDALLAGSDYLVIGRSITKSLNPIETLFTLYSALSQRQV